MSKFYLLEEGCSCPSVYATDGFKIATNREGVYYVQLGTKWYIVPDGVRIQDNIQDGVKVGIRIRYKRFMDTRYTNKNLYGEHYMLFLKRLALRGPMYKQELRIRSKKIKQILPHVFENKKGEWMLDDPTQPAERYICLASIPNALKIATYESERIISKLKSLEVKESEYER